MRSYRDTLIEYDSEVAFKELQSKWTCFLANQLNCPESNFSIFQNQESHEGLFELENSKQLAGVTENLLFSEYQKIILQFEDYIDLQLKPLLNDNFLAWLNYKSDAKRAIERGGELFDMDFLFKNWCDLNKHSLEDKVDSNFYNDIKETFCGHVLVNSIEKFHIYKADLFAFEKDESRDSSRIGDFQFNFRIQDQCLADIWSQINVSQEVDDLVNFSDKSIDTFMLRFNKANIEVEGEFYKTQLVPIQFNKWCSKELINVMLTKDAIPIKNCLPKSIDFDKSLLEKLALSDLFISEGVKLKIKVFETFTNQEIEILQENAFDVFPFYPKGNNTHEYTVRRINDDEINFEIISKSKNIIGLLRA